MRLPGKSSFRDFGYPSEGLAFSAEERRLILAAVREHRKKKDGAEPIAALFMTVTSVPVPVFSCPAEKECNWKDEEKNKGDNHMIIGKRV